MKMKWFVGFVFAVILFTGGIRAEEPLKPLTLEESIKIALDQSLAVHSAMVGIKGSQYRQYEAITNFLPTWTGQYSWTKSNQPVLLESTSSLLLSLSSSKSALLSPTPDKNIYNFNTTLNQPIFTGGLNLANYRTAKLGVDFSKMGWEAANRDLVLQVRTGYFNILRTEKFLDVADQQVKQFEAQLNVSKAFFEVGIVAKNDVLLAEVNLANAKQSLTKAGNDVTAAKASFNIILRREVDTLFEVVDILAYEPFPTGFEDSLAEALRQRPEIKAAQINVDQTLEGVKIARSGYFPMVSLLGNYSRSADNLILHGGRGNFIDDWSIQALATITLWNWGDTEFKVQENKVKVLQAEDSKKQVVDSITFEVKNDYLNLQTAEKNVNVAQVAISQAEENLRMNEERYKYQVATQTDVVNAVTLLAQARVNYYGALSDFNIAKAQLERAMGRMYP